MSRWLFFPTQASGADWSDAWASSEFLGSCVADGNAGQNPNPFSLTTGTLASNLGTTQQFQQASSNAMDTVGPDYNAMYYTEGARWLVWYLDTFGWQKFFMWAAYAPRQSTWSGATFFATGYRVGDYSPIVFAMFSADPGDVSLWNNYNGPTS